MNLLRRMMRTPLFALLLCTMPICAKLEVDINQLNARLLRMLEMRFCYISFVAMDNQEELLIKQKKSNCFRKIVSVVRDCVTAEVAENFGIAHKVDIIPAGKDFPGKPRKDWPATIHTIAPGKMIKAQNSPYDRMNIKQADEGFRRDMLAWMAMHPVLLIMVAMDTFLCNHDRHRGNLFYEPGTNSFCAIDMDSAFKYNLCALACKNFTKMINDKRVRLSSKEIRTLTSYKEYIEFLIDKCHPEETVARYNYFAEKAGFVPGSPLYTQKIALELERNKRVIMQSYQDAQRLIPILEKLIKISKKRLKQLI
jgi:hypothetical protein